VDGVACSSRNPRIEILITHKKLTVKLHKDPGTQLKPEWLKFLHQKMMNFSSLYE
jgi:hypothetical protein